MKTKYMNSRNQRTDARTTVQRFRGGKLVPVMAVPFMQSEGGFVSQSVNVELDQIPGRLLSRVTAHVQSVFVPMIAADIVKNPEDEHVGNTELFRQKYLSGDPVFGLEAETEVSQRMGVNPRSISGDKLVNEVTRLSQIAAVNFLRRRKYTYAAQIPNTSSSVTPALLGATVLDRLNGVLDPEDRVNGSVQLTGEVPIKGLGFRNSITHTAPNNTGYGVGAVDAQGNPTSEVIYGKVVVGPDDLVGGSQAKLVVEAHPENTLATYLRADFDSADGQSLSLQDFYTAERMDALTREMRRVVDENPEYGESIVARMAHGLRVEGEKQPIIVYDRAIQMGGDVERAMDGPNLGIMSTNSMATIPFTVPIPQTEFGGVLVTFVSIKPDETLISQPHPVLSDVIVGRNFSAEDLAIEPVPLTIRDVHSDCQANEEGTTVMYVGPNHIYRRYTSYGFTRNMEETVDNKSAVWQLEVPYSVTPDSIVYPENLSHYPFADQEAEVVHCTVNSQASIRTPIHYGPTPVEELAIIEEQDISADIDAD